MPTFATPTLFASIRHSVAFGLLAPVAVCLLLLASAARINGQEFAALSVAAPVDSDGESLEANIPVEAIDVDDLESHVEFLADDSLEGREAGTRGGRAAGNYAIEIYREHGLVPLGDDGGYVQQFGSGYRNLLGMIEGSHPELKEEFIVIGAHYDHVGYGNASNSYGPVGRIHNGADDNGSGTAALLEIVEALSTSEEKPARSIIVALWDAEEKGLLGSYHWVREPTVKLSRVRLMINIDMIGRLRNDALEVYGIRTAPGLRRLASKANTDDLRLDFNWDVLDDSDHYPFFAREIPIVMYHTGLHDQYHRPSDDTHTVNFEGLEQVAHMTLRTAWIAADAVELPSFREGSRHESDRDRRQLEQSQSTRPSRVGMSIATVVDADGAESVQVTDLESGGPAMRAGLREGDQIIQVDGKPVTSRFELSQTILRAAESCRLQVSRQDGSVEEIVIELRGTPVRVGLSWLPDAADPSLVYVTQVIAGSPADDAGLASGDRIQAIDGESFDGSKDLLSRLQEANGTVILSRERRGRVRDIEVRIGEPLQ